MKLLAFLVGIAISSPICSDSETNKLPAAVLNEDMLRLHEKFAAFNGTELENLGKKTYFVGLGKPNGPYFLMQVLEYGNFDYKQFGESVSKEERLKKMILDLKFAKNKNHLFESYGNAYKMLADYGAYLF